MRVSKQAEVVAVDPFHFHQADAIAIDPVMHVQQVVLLDLGDVRGHDRHAAHGLVVGAVVFVALGREDLQGHGEGEIVGAAPQAEVHDPLPARSEHPHQPVVFGPTQPLLVEHGTVAAEELVGATGGLMPSPGPGAVALKKYRSGHPRLRAARFIPG